MTEVALLVLLPVAAGGVELARRRLSGHRLERLLAAERSPFLWPAAEDGGQEPGALEWGAPDHPPGRQPPSSAA